MAIFTSTIMTRAKGSIGNVTITTQKGRMIAKQKISIMRNPRTAGQMEQRGRLTLSVAMWRYLGSVIKSGITVFSQFGNPYTGFIAQNIKQLTSSQANPADLKNRDFEGIQATSGQLGSVNFTLDLSVPADPQLDFPAGALKNIATIGDKVKLVCGSSSEYAMAYAEYSLSAADLLATSDNIVFDADLTDYADEPVWVAWVESKDGQKSSTQFFVKN